MARLRHRARAVLLTGLAALAACSRDRGEPGALRVEGPALGTSFSLTVPRAAAAERSRIAAAARDEIERVDRLMSTYREDSEISRFNRHRSTDPFPLSEETLAVLEAARSASALTGGAFDVTVGPLVDAWGFGPDGRGVPPSDDDLERLRGRTGWRRLELEPQGGRARKGVPGLQCDLSAIAKGYAVDRVASALERLGYRDHFVEVGGEVRAGGTNQDGGPWRVGVERPVAVGRSVQRILRVSDTGAATSGDYRDFRELDGRRLGHVLDPRTGRPASGRVASATVLDPSAMRADALATAMLALGEREGLALAEREGLAVLLIVREADGSLREAVSSGLRARMSAEGP